MAIEYSIAPLQILLKQQFKFRLKWMKIFQDFTFVRLCFLV